MVGTPKSPHIIPEDSTALDIEDLTINTEYRVTVSASTSTGQGAEAVQIGQTDEDGKERQSVYILF